MTTLQFVAPVPAPTWTDTPEEILALADNIIREGTSFDDKIAALENPTIENLIYPMIQSDHDNSLLAGRLCFYHNSFPDKEVRNASNEASRRFSKYAIESGLREDVFKNLKKVYEDVKDDNSLDPELKRYIYKVYNDYRRNGLDLPLEKRKQVEAISKELSDLSIEYSRNLAEQKEFLLFTEEELEGVPENIISQFERVDDKLKVTFKYPDILPVVEFAKKPSTRKTAFLGDQNKVPANAELLKKAVIKRAELAQTLGYTSYSQYVLEERMAKNSKKVWDFENDLWEKAKGKGQSELESLKRLKLKEYKELGFDVDSKDAQEYYFWDHSHYNNLLLEQEYQVDELKIAEYFPIGPTIEKMLGFYERLFNLKFVEVTEGKSVWHEDVKQITLWKLDDPENPEYLGLIYLDLHPRDGKYGHAAHFTIKTGFYDFKKKEKSRPVSALLCNFSKPQQDKPALLKHREVKTFFHELGHGIHALVSDVKYSKFHGTRVSRDFVEAPSQMLEYWVWTAPELKKLSSHYETGEPLDDQLINSLVKSKDVNQGLATLRQLHFGIFDMTLHDSKDGDVDVDRAWNNLREEITLLSLGNETTKGYGSFGHMMGGYASGYYGYLYSKVFAADIYYSIFKQDPFNTAKGIRYRDTVLKKGGSRDEIDSLKELLGREPNSNAFFADMGISQGKL